MSLLRQLHAASLPFTTRALRGGRRLRYSVGALLLTLLTVVLGFWIALGPGHLEHELRVGFNLERDRSMQEQRDNIVFVDSAAEAAILSSQIDDLRQPDRLRAIAEDRLRDRNLDLWQAEHALQSNLDILAFAANAPPLDRNHAEVQRQARALQQRLGLPPYASYSVDWFHWYNQDDLARVRAVIASDMHPQVRVYASPLGVPDAVRLTGILAGGITLVLLLLFAPVLAGTQMAQEVHENTLQPLTGTALDARQLVLGMTVGPLAVIGLVAAPQVVLLLGTAAVTGGLLSALCMLAVGLAGGLFLTMLAQLAGLALGKQRTPGMIGVALLGALVPLTMLGTALAIDLPNRMIGMLALLPQASSAYLLFEAFVPPSTQALSAFYVELSPQPADAHFAAIVGTLGALCFAFLGLRALERRIGDLAPTALTRIEALFGALVSVVLITLANPWQDDHYNPGQFYFLNLVLAFVPLAILLMMRVPQSDTPLALRRIPVAALVGEFAAMVAVFFAVCIATMGLENFTLLGSPVAIAYMLWTVAVAALIAIRVAAMPMTLLARLWIGVCTIGLGVAFAHAADWTRSTHHETLDIIGLARVSPLLGLLQVVLLVVIPLTLVRALRNPGTAAPSEA